jgi:isopentenyldiphosphate isomerase
MTGDELLDVLNAEGTPTGTKSRSDVHRDGDWHAAFHLWVVSGDDVLLQHRGEQKQAWPNLLDATAAGHLTAGESALDGLREAEEELGVRYATGALVPLGVFTVDEPQPDGTHNREFQHVYAIRDNTPLTEFTAIDRTDLRGLVAVRRHDFAQLADGRAVAGIAWDGERAMARRVTSDDLVPTPYIKQIVPQLTTI